MGYVAQPFLQAFFVFDLVCRSLAHIFIASEGKWIAGKYSVDARRIYRPFLKIFDVFFSCSSGNVGESCFFYIKNFPHTFRSCCRYSNVATSDRRP